MLIYANGYKVAHFNTALGQWIGYGDKARTHILNTWNKPTHSMPLPAPPSEVRMFEERRNE